MLRRFILYILTLMLLLGHAFAQNLVPNPGFEEYNNCPVPNTGGIQHPNNGEPYIKKWVTMGTVGGVFAFDSCALPYQSSTWGLWANVPDNLMGYRYAHTGHSYAGIWIQNYGDPPGPDINAAGAQYIQNKLLQPLEAGQWYCVSFYVAPAYRKSIESQFVYFRRQCAVDLLGIHFSEDRPDNNFPSLYLSLIPQVESPKGHVLDDTSVNWTPITGVFKAQGGEEWLTIGCFHAASELTKKLINNVTGNNPEDTVSGNPFYYIDDVNINKISVAPGEYYLGKSQDTVICNGTTILNLYAPPGADSYEWNTGATTRIIQTDPNIQKYWFKAWYPGCGIVTDTIKVTHLQATLDLGKDTGACIGSSYIIKPTNGTTFATYEWNTGSTGSQITVNQTGTYILKVTDSCGVQTDSVRIIFYPKPSPPLVRDTVVCLNSAPATLGVTGSALRWYKTLNGGTPYTEPPLSTDQPGRYILFVTQSEHGCESDKASFTIDVISPPLITLVPDTVFCPGDIPIVDIGQQEGSHYQWSSGEQTSFINPGTSGVYSLSVTNLCGTAFDSIRVRFDECIDCAWIPSAFSPNSDGINDFFGAEVKCPLQNYQLSVYNRWGQKVFESYRPENRWNGENASLGTYFFYLRYRNKNTGEIINKKGDITLLR